MEWKLTFLGTGAGLPSPTRGASCTALQIKGDVWLFDCGEGSQIQLMRSTLRLSKINKIFITHLHGDHLFGLPGLLCTITQNVTDESKPAVKIYGPPGLASYLRQSLSLSYSLLGFKYEVYELVDDIDEEAAANIPPEFNFMPIKTPAAPHQDEAAFQFIPRLQDGSWFLFEEENMKVYAAALKHRVPCVGFVIEEGPLPGKLDAAKLVSLGVPQGPLFAKIKSGQSIEHNGAVINPKDVLGPERNGRKVVILGDTSDCTLIYPIAQNADVLLHEATNENKDIEKSIQNGHSTPSMAVDCAKALCAKKLILFHLSQRYKPIGEPLKEGEASVECLLDEAKVSFENVLVAYDFLSVNIPVSS